MSEGSPVSVGRVLVDRSLARAFPDAPIVDHGADASQGHWWVVRRHGSIMALRVLPEVLAQPEDETRALLERVDLARMLRGSAGRVTVLGRHGVWYVPAIPT